MNLLWHFEPVKVEFHLDNGYTKVVYVRLVGLGMLEDWFTGVAEPSMNGCDGSCIAPLIPQFWGT